MKTPSLCTVTMVTLAMGISFGTGARSHIWGRQAVGPTRPAWTCSATRTWSRTTGMRFRGPARENRGQGLRASYGVGGRGHALPGRGADHRRSGFSAITAGACVIGPGAGDLRTPGKEITGRTPVCRRRRGPCLVAGDRHAARGAGGVPATSLDSRRAGVVNVPADQQGQQYLKPATGSR